MSEFIAHLFCAMIPYISLSLQLKKSYMLKIYEQNSLMKTFDIILRYLNLYYFCPNTKFNVTFLSFHQKIESNGNARCNGNSLIGVSCRKSY